MTSTYCPPATNAHSIVWETNNPKTGRLQSISGIYVPSPCQFTVKVQKTQPSVFPVAIALTDKHLYRESAVDSGAHRRSRFRSASSNAHQKLGSRSTDRGRRCFADTGSRDGCSSEPRGGHPTEL
jgi:hypothetical protein